LLIVVTNQSAVARGLASEAQIERVNRRLVSELGKSGASLDAIYVCPHHPDASGDGVRAHLAIVCNCRKPQLGMVERACREFGIDLARSWMVGDHTRDIETARRAGIRSILVKTGHAGLDGEWASKPDHVVEDLASAAQLIASVDLEPSDQSAQPLSSP
jgi:histidinol-phosphate phosphatase family protein